ncbi:MAG TPA: hypothetical protein VKR06_10645 [Ktedonosporobacter sp.]|nr:hypothetical protein [Ktedonosporobacter sp.]
MIQGKNGREEAILPAKEALPPLVEAKPEEADDQASAGANQRANALLPQHQQRFSRSSLQPVEEATSQLAFARPLRRWQLLLTATPRRQPGLCQQTQETSGGEHARTPAGSKLVAVGTSSPNGLESSSSSGTILTSSDGNAWITQNFSISQGLRSVVWSGSQFVAVGSGGIIVTSLDGRTWTAQRSGTSEQHLESVTWSGTQFVAVGDSGIILTSP